MSSQLITNAQLILNAVLSNNLDLGTSVANIQPSIRLALTNGTGLNQCNRVFSDSRTLAALTSENIDLYDFSGAVDPLGQVFTLSKIKGVIIQNKSVDTDAALIIGGEGSAATWNSGFNADDDGKAVCGPGGLFVIMAPSAAGLAVVDASNHLLKIENLGANSVAYDIIILGSQ